MTRTYSTVPAVKAALVAALAARSGLAGVLVTYGLPAHGPPAEWISVGGADGTQEPRGIQRATMPKREEYDLEITVSVLRGPHGQQEATERAFAIASEIDTELRDDPTIGGVAGLLFAYPEGDFALVEAASKNEREGRVTLTVSCAGRI